MVRGKFVLYSFLCTWIVLFGVLSGVNSQIPLGSKLSVIEKNYWVSPNGNFAFGFFNRSDQPDLFNAGIWFNSASIPFNEQRVVWVAGSDVSVASDSFIHLTVAGDLVIFDSLNGVAVWNSNTSHLSVASAALLDTGNLVLLNDNHSIVWQSFEIPSDSLLPGQFLSVRQNLRAASRNSISSYYTLSMSSFGQLKLSWETSVTYWKSNFFHHPIFGVSFTKDGAMQVLDESSKPVWSILGEDHNDSSVLFRFLRLDVDGNLRMYSWVEASKSWRSVWQAVENQCNVFATCGLHGVCVFSESGTTICKCPFGARNDLNSRCLAPYTEKCSSGVTMLALEHTFLHGLYPPKDLVNQSNSEHCRNSCFQNPLCTSVTVTNDGRGECWSKQTRYVTGYAHPSISAISYFKACLDPVAALPGKFPAAPASLPAPPRNKQPKRFGTAYLIESISGTLCAFILIQIGIAFWYLRRRSLIERRRLLDYRELHSSGLVPLSYSEIQDITKNFKNHLGSNIFKGTLANNQPVVVKNLKDSGTGMVMDEKQLRCAISVIGSVHHKNLVRLEGFCCESEHRYLVSEYAKNGSVAKWIKDAKLSKRLTWRKRMEICVGVARAITYLHSGCREFVNHGKLKLHNVVLDEEMGPKVTDFGLGKLVGSSALGNYKAAEHDVSMFGEMIISIASGRIGGIEVCRWAHAKWLEGGAQTVVDARLEGDWDAEELERALRIAFWCIQDDERLRPGMAEVMKVLEGTLAVDLPPSPFTRQRHRTEPVLQSFLEIETD